MAIQFFVPGIARTAGSKIASKTKEGKPFVRPAGKFTKAWMDTVRYFAYQHVNRMCLLQGAVKLSITFFIARPKGHYGTGRNADILKNSAPTYPISTPDLSKLTRAVEDALTGLIWKNDSCIVIHSINKVYGGPCGAKILIEEIN